MFAFQCIFTMSSERYTEQVTPLLVYAQRQLLLRISKFENADIIQQPCIRYETEYKEKVGLTSIIYAVVISY